MNLIAPLITLETVRLNLDVISRKRLYEEASLLFESSAGVSHTEAFDALIARERLGSTCVGGGCAIPHGRLKEISEPIVVFLRTTNPISLDALDGRPVQLFICLLIPDDDNDDYLKLLRETAALFSDKSTRQALLTAQSEIDICQLIHNWVAPQDIHFEQDFDDTE
ncbi:PTS IIA-like nitrogen-regulatory protein PtsN [gut metagenome]|uniref:PTS IIA-like nitrogen-regulatory protein PtsN n=1 Tax=gut metagenome TaxID=749906 RepID=J9GKW3_9ZZZZ